MGVHLEVYKYLWTYSTQRRKSNNFISNSKCSIFIWTGVNISSDNYAIPAQRKLVDNTSNIGSVYLYKLVSGTWQEETEQIVPTIPNGTGITTTWSSSSQQPFFGSAIDFDGTT